MSRYRNDDADDYDDSYDEDYEVDEEDEYETDPCPHCGEPVHHEAILCPHCDRYLSKEDAPAEKKPRWFVITAIVCLIIAVIWAVF